jgi:hypothetical protein
MKVHTLGRTMSQIAIDECVGELRAACRRPIDPAALDKVVEAMRGKFERILDRTDGGKRWADHGQRMRNNSRHLGALADFFGSHADVDVVGEEELSHAVGMMRADCTTRSERTPLGWEYCEEHPPKSTAAAEEYLRAIASEPALASLAS